MSTDFHIDDLVPHSNTMSLLSRVSDYGNNWLEAEIDINTSSLFVESKGVPSWVGIEYMAQAIAAYSGIQENKQQGSPKIGFLLGARHYKVNNAWFIIGSKLSVHVQCEMIAENGLHVFNAKLTAQNVLATARLNVFQPDNVSDFLRETSS